MKDFCMIGSLSPANQVSLIFPTGTLMHALGDSATDLATLQLKVLKQYQKFGRLNFMFENSLNDIDGYS